jgi:hypothetical protein
MKRLLCVCSVAVLMLAVGCEDDIKEGLGVNNGVNNGANNGANNGDNNGNVGPQRPDPGRPGNGDPGPECEVPTDCSQPLPLGCNDGSWRCTNNMCIAECETLPCTYECTMDCQCKVDDQGCEIPECAEDCGDLAAEMELAQEELRGCDAADDTCSLVGNADCGVAGDCFLLLSSAADPEPLRQLRLRYAASQCLGGEDCDCDEPEATAVCIGGQCRIEGDASCAEPTDCEGLPHDACEGEWGCNDELCAWECAADCSELGQAVADERATQAGCDEQDTCIATLNPLCGGVGDCYYFHPADADLGALAGLETDYTDGECQTADCDCAEAPALDCIEGTCQPAQD